MRRMIPRSRLRYIPKNLRSKHEYLFFLHDEAVRILVEYEKERAHWLNIKFENAQQSADFQRIADDTNVIEALRRLGFTSEAKRTIINQMTMALSSDFLHHIYEGLRCLEKRKFIVAYNLFRKPLLDNLSFLCWIFSDEAGFYAAFTNDGPASLSSKAMGNRRDSIFRSAFALTSVKEILDIDFILQDLFDHRSEYTLYKFFQHAVHLVTVQKKEIATEHENLNFIFKNPGDDDIYQTSYETLPAIMLFSIQVIGELFNRMRPMNTGSKRAFDIRTQYGYLLTMEPEAPRMVADNLNRNYRGLFRCPHCNESFNFTRNNSIGAVVRESYRCNACGHYTLFPFSWMIEPED